MQNRLGLRSTRNAINENEHGKADILLFLSVRSNAEVNKKHVRNTWTHISRKDDILGLNLIEKNIYRYSFNYKKIGKKLN